MGKSEEDTVAIVGRPPSADSSSCFQKPSCRWIISVVLGVYLLVFAILTIHFRGRSGSGSQSTSVDPWKYEIEASFRLRRPVSLINASLSQLQSDLQDELGVPFTEVNIISVFQLSSSNWTEVRFEVRPDQSNDSIMPADLSLLKETFVQLFMKRSVNLSLTSELFGKVSQFQVEQFPGGITVVPEQPGFPLSHVLVLFNFTLHNSLSHVECNFAEFREQLAAGIALKANESLFVQLTNLEGSTLKSPLIVQTSILPVVGLLLAPPRLKQLAQEIIASPRRNLGLNHTLFGRVKGIELSSYLEYSLDPALAPSSCPSPSPSIAPERQPRAHRAHRAHGSRGHLQQSPAPAPSSLTPFWSPRAPASEYNAATPHHHHDSVLPPSPSASPSAAHMSPRISRSPVTPSPNSPFPAPAVSYHDKLYPAGGPSPVHNSPPVESPKNPTALANGPSKSSYQGTPVSVAAPSPFLNVPAVSPTSSASMLSFHSIALVAWLILVVKIW